MQSPEALVVILGTGGTIAGTASDTTDHVGYTAGQLGVNQLVAAVPVLAGGVQAARDVRKVHPYRVDAFGSGDAGVIGEVEQGALRLHRPWPDEGAPLGVDRLPAADAAWPRVEIVTSHAGSDGEI